MNITTVPNVSIIIPAYNSARFLPEAIESVFAQTYKDYEIIVVDDGSTDNTKEILAPYFDKIKYVYQQNKGAASARNTGIRHSQGEYIAFLDADDVWLPEKLHVQVEYLDNDPGIAMIYSRTLWMDVDCTLIGKENRYKDLPSGNIFNTIFSHSSFIHTPTVMIRKRVLDTVGLFNESLITSEDRDLWLRIARDFKVSGINEPLCKCRHTPGSLSKNKEAVYKFRRLVIEQNYKASKDSGRPIAPALYKKTLARLFFRTGKWHLSRGERKKALENFFLSLKYRPFNQRILKILRYCFIIYIKEVLVGFTMLRR